MSASVTGEWSVPFVHRLNGRRAVARASSPASRITASSGSPNARTSLAGNGQALHTQCRCIGAVAEFQVVGRGKRAEHVKQIPRNRNAAYGIGALAILDPESRGATAVIARDHVRAHADEVGDVKTIGNIRDERVGTWSARLQMQIAGSGRSRRRAATMGVAGGNETELARCRTIQQPGSKHAVFDHCELLAANTLAVERPGAQPALA